MVDMYEKYGYYRDEVKPFLCPVLKASKNPVDYGNTACQYTKELAGMRVVSARDYKKMTLLWI